MCCINWNISRMECKVERNGGGVARKEYWNISRMECKDAESS